MPAAPRPDSRARPRPPAARQNRPAGDRDRSGLSLRRARLSCRARLLRRRPQHELQHRFYRVLADIQGEIGGGSAQEGKHTGILHDLDELFTLRSSTLHLLGIAIFIYALVEGAEAVGLWYQQRWAEYLTFIATALFLPLEVYELTTRVSPFKVSALLINLAILVYLVSAKRLFGFRGGVAAEQAAHERDVGWPALKRTEPGVGSP